VRAVEDLVRRQEEDIDVARDQPIDERHRLPDIQRRGAGRVGLADRKPRHCGKYTHRGRLSRRIPLRERG